MGRLVPEPRQRRAVGAQQEDRLDQVAPGLLHRQRGQLPVVERALRHHPVHRERRAAARSGPGSAPAPPGRRAARPPAADARSRSRARRPSPPRTRSALDPGGPRQRGERGPGGEQHVDASREPGVISSQRVPEPPGQPVDLQPRLRGDARPGEPAAASRAAASRPARSAWPSDPGTRRCPRRTRRSAGIAPGSAMIANRARAGSSTIGQPQ